MLPTPSAAEQISQLSLRLQYRELARCNAPLPALFETEFRAYSQNGEDGILWFLFSLLGTTNRRAVEICAGDGVECNAANLVINHTWSALLVDGDAAQIARGQDFYRQCRNTCVSPPVLAQAWITAETVNDIVAKHGFAGEIDLLSLDLDGNDYWVWKALTAVRPRVVVLEFNGSAGPDRRLTISYDPAFRFDFSITPYRVGASLAAFTALAAEKGYRLVGVQSLGFNAFFVREDVQSDWLPTRTPGECYAGTPRLSDWRPAHLDQLLTGDQSWDEV